MRFSCTPALRGYALNAHLKETSLYSWQIWMESCTTLMWHTLQPALLGTAQKWRISPSTHYLKSWKITVDTDSL